MPAGGNTGGAGQGGSGANSGPTVTSISLGVGDELPEDDQYTGYMTLGTFSIDSSGQKVVIANSEGIGSQGYLYCGGSHYFWSA